MADFSPTQQEIANAIDPADTTVVIVDSVTPTYKATVTSGGALLVTGAAGSFQVKDNQAAVLGTDLGTVSVGYDGTNYQFISVNASGELKVGSLPNVTLASQANPFTSAIPVSGTFWQATQPVSGTVTANQGSPNASSANAWFTKLVDSAGTNVAGVDTQNHQYVSGKSAVGVAPTSNPVSISGVDAGGLKRIFLTDTTGIQLAKITDGTNVAGVDTANALYVAGKAAVGVVPSSNPVSISGVDGGGLKRIPLLDTAGRLQTNIAQWFGSTVPTVGQKSMGNSIPVTIASDQSPIPVGGILTWVDNGYMFCCSSEQNAASSTANNPIYLIKNPAGSGKNLYLWKIQAGTNVANVSVVFRVFMDPTVTANGTADTIVQRNIGSAVASIAQVYTLPTVSASGIEISALSAGQNNNAIIFTDDFSVKVQPGHSLLITAKPVTNGRSVVMTCIWAEVA